MGNSFPEVNISVELSKDKAQALKDYQENGATYQESHPRQSSKYTTLCLETILFSELSRYNRQAGISGRTMDAGSCHVLLTNSFWEPPNPRVSTESTTPQFHWHVHDPTRHKDHIVQLENLCIEIRKPRSKLFLVVTWYRPPDSSVEIFTYFESLIGKIDAEYAEFYLMGDLNCNFAAPQLDHNANLLSSIADVYSLQQLITVPTRCTYWTIFNFNWSHFY